MLTKYSFLATNVFPSAHVSITTLYPGIIINFSVETDPISVGKYLKNNVHVLMGVALSANKAQG